VTPLDLLTKDLLLRTCPKKVTNTVTKDNSIVLANKAKKVDAVAGVNDPPECMARPYRGCAMASISQIPEKMVEYMESMRIEIESQLRRDECISPIVGQPPRRPGTVSNPLRRINPSHG
jgi:hypothetical protein